MQSWIFVGIGFACYLIALIAGASAAGLVWLSFGIAANIVGTVLGFRNLIRRAKGD